MRHPSIAQPTPPDLFNAATASARPARLRVMLFDVAVVLTDGGVLLLNISSLSGPQPERWLADGGWTVRELDRLRVPLKVNAVTSGVTPESRAWLDFLRERGIVSRGDGYDFWHDLRMLECRFE